jgi:adenosylcobinamide-phosphate synthase
MLPVQILLALLLDLLVGDPRWFPHPVRLIGRLALLLESFFRKLIANRYLAGVVTVIIVLLVIGLMTYIVIQGATLLHPLAGTAVSVFLLYTTLAVNDLTKHSRSVGKALLAGDLATARKRVSMLVSRDTGHLQEEGIARSCVESVVENMVDGVTAPLFFAALGGPVAAMLYKAVNTMDSTFGYKNERYKEFGWAAARLDDLVNFVPARLTALLVPIAAMLLRLQVKDAVRIFLRDRYKNTSPNSGQIEAAAAGALGIQLGGLNYYHGKACNYPTIGDGDQPVTANHIVMANRLLFVVSALAAVCFVAFGHLVHQL